MQFNVIASAAATVCALGALFYFIRGQLKLRRLGSQKLGMRFETTVLAILSGLALALVGIGTSFWLVLLIVGLCTSTYYFLAYWIDRIRYRKG